MRVGVLMPKMQGRMHPCSAAAAWLRVHVTKTLPQVFTELPMENPWRKLWLSGQCKSKHAISGVSNPPPAHVCPMLEKGVRGVDIP